MLDMNKVLEALEHDSAAQGFAKAVLGADPTEEETSIDDLLRQILKGQLMLMQEIEELKEKLDGRP